VLRAAAGAGRGRVGDTPIPAQPAQGNACGRALIARVFEPVDQEWHVAWRSPQRSAASRPPTTPFDAIHASVFFPESQQAFSWQPLYLQSAAGSCRLDRPQTAPPSGGLHARSGLGANDGVLRKGLRRLLALSPRDGSAATGVPERWMIMHGRLPHASDPAEGSAGPWWRAGPQPALN